MMDVSKTTKQSCSRDFMKKYLENALEEKAITKKALNEWKTLVMGIESGEGTAPEKLKAVKVAFYEKFILPEKQKLKAKKTAVSAKKSSHPLYDMFNEIGKEKPVEEKKD